MDYPPKDKFLKTRPDNVHTIRKLYNLDQPGQMQEAVNILDDWVQKQKHFLKKDFSPVFLETSILACKGSIERAKRQIDKICTYRTLLPSFFSKTDIKNDVGNLHDIAHLTLLPMMTSDHFRILFTKINNLPVESSNLMDFYRFGVVLAEYMRIHDYTNGFIFVADFREINIMDLVTKLNPSELRQALSIYMEGYGMRLKGIHLITSSKLVETLVTILKQILSEKISKRIFVHKTDETLFDYVPQELFPREYGGKERSLKELRDNFIDILTSKEHQTYLKEIYRAKTNESCRQVDKFNEEYAGLPGSFRVLSVD